MGVLEAGEVLGSIEIQLIIKAAQEQGRKRD